MAGSAFPHPPRPGSPLDDEARGLNGPPKKGARRGRLALPAPRDQLLSALGSQLSTQRPTLNSHRPLNTVLNLSAYKFTPLDCARLPELRDALRASCQRAGLKGTILLSTEGINLFVAGTRAGADVVLAMIREIPGLADLTPKESLSAAQPFRRMLVKIKREIIAFGVEGIDPARQPAPKLAPRTLKQWLDEGRAITLLDTRNRYEVRAGTFRGAIDPEIDRFRDFPQAVDKLPPALKNQPVVMFCTGGIRCEKAGPLLQREGFAQVYQLDGGILKYFEECGNAHYDGECFVFDERGTLGPAPTDEPSAISH